MQLNPSFAALLAGVLLTFSENVVAAPAKRQPTMITLPLKRVEQRSDVHPQIVCRIFKIGVAVLNFYPAIAPPTTHQPWRSSPRPNDWS